MSGALRVALDLAELVDLTSLEKLVRDEGVAAREEAMNELYGRLLGPNAEDAEARFVSFANRASNAVGSKV